MKRERKDKMPEKNPTGYPSVDKPWLKYYKPGAEEAATNIPEGKTVWDVIEERLLQYKDIPAIEYFGRKISRPEFIDMVYTWAKAFKALGVKEDEVVPYYGPFFPDVGAMAFALNIIGACPYFLKLAIAPEALAEETTDARFAIAYGDMWANVCGEFSKERFEKVIIVTAADAMPIPKKQIVSLLGKLKRDKNTPPIPRGGKYLRLDEAKKYSARYSGEVKAQFVPERAAFITSSSGTTVNGIVKGTVATSESTIAQLRMGDVSGIQYFSGDTCLNHFPPTAATSLNCLFFLPLFKGMTVLMDPRVSEIDFYNQIARLKPNIVLTTGSSWEAYYNRIEREMQAGKTFDFSFAKGWTVGGEGTDILKFNRWNALMQRGGARGIYSGYGTSELFSAVSVETVDARYSPTKKILSVGIPYVGITVGVFDPDGNELGYNRRGELWVKSRSAMKEYYKKLELTAKTKVDGWIHTGDLAEIDENGFVYIWGRCNDTIALSDGREIYLFDIANKIKEKDYIDDAVVMPISSQGQEKQLAVHIVWTNKLSDAEKVQRVTELNEMLNDYLPSELVVFGYAEHEEMLPYSPTTLKKDKNRMSKQRDGYYQVVEGKLASIGL